MDLKNARLVLTAITRGTENSNNAVRKAMDDYRAGRICWAEYELMESAARGLGVQRHSALCAWNAGAYL